IRTVCCGVGRYPGRHSKRSASRVGMGWWASSASSQGIEGGGAAVWVTHASRVSKAVASTVLVCQGKRPVKLGRVEPTRKWRLETADAVAGEGRQLNGAPPPTPSRGRDAVDAPCARA